ncbi:hypothetical protein BD833_11143 [Blastococcus xanthinilyticus]|uniref:Uncharacterized protein n=2 Tax=Blastococcus xanthinilyticus TaxID=1564164 RepID=A0A5S5CTL8_9ACTN|nr:hypothetical protein BD833_11143 [Blastococcus xanthinilyticus]
MLVGVGDLHYVLAPAVVLVVVALLALFLRWAFGSGRGRGTPSAADDGLLVRVATLSRRDWAAPLQAHLAAAGIRSTVRTPTAHRTEVLVFPDDAGRAAALVASFDVGGGT